jgi:hypothetical protein
VLPDNYLTSVAAVVTACNRTANRAILRTQAITIHKPFLWYLDGRMQTDRANQTRVLTLSSLGYTPKKPIKTCTSIKYIAGSVDFCASGLNGISHLAAAVAHPAYTAFTPSQGYLMLVQYILPISSTVPAVFTIVAQSPSMLTHIYPI